MCDAVAVEALKAQYASFNMIFFGKEWKENGFLVRWNYLKTNNCSLYIWQIFAFVFT